MLANIMVGCTLVVLTTIIHGASMLGVVRALTTVLRARLHEKSHWARAIVVAALVLIMFLAALIEAGAWAVTYSIVGAFPDLEEALYFSTVTYTTLGYGDVVVEGRWRLLTSLEAANGIIMFGWTTALIVAVVQRVYFTKETGDA
jgi:voltage-gated potassium channel Kch